MSLCSELRRISKYSPEHLPGQIELIELFGRRFRVFGRWRVSTLRFIATCLASRKLLPIPRRFDEKGIRRFGFHGLSYAFLMEELERLAGKDAAQGRVILAHLGNGSSLAAVREGKSVDTTMAFTPASGSSDEHSLGGSGSRPRLVSGANREHEHRAVPSHGES